MAKIEKSFLTPKWLEVKSMYENGTNGSNKYGTNYAQYKLKAMKTQEDILKEKEEKAKLLLRMKKYDSVKFGNDLNGNRYFKIGYWKPINSNDQYYVKQHSKLKFEEKSVWDDDCGYKYWYSINKKHKGQ